MREGFAGHVKCCGMLAPFWGTQSKQILRNRCTSGWVRLQQSENAIPDVFKLLQDLAGVAVQLLRNCLLLVRCNLHKDTR